MPLRLKQDLGKYDHKEVLVCWMPRSLLMKFSKVIRESTMLALLIVGSM